MMVPITSAVCRELFLAVPRDLEEGALALGATRWEMVRGVTLQYARSGVVGAVILGLGRALGEAIAVTQVIGNYVAPERQPLRPRRYPRESDRQPVPGSRHGADPPLLDLSRAGAARDHADHERDRPADRPPLQRTPAGLSVQVSTPPLSLTATGRSRRRLRISRIAEIAAVSAALLAVGVLVLLVGSVFVRGYHALNLDLFTKGPATFGQTGGGISQAFVGTIVLMVLATAIALPIGVLVSIYVSEFAPPRLGRAGAPLARRAERLPCHRDRHLRLHPARRRATDRAVTPGRSRSRSS